MLSLVLRHSPQAIGISLDANGWTDVDTLISKARQGGKALDHETLLRIVATNDKKRFTLSEDGTRIRAAQGHSIEVDLALAPIDPPAILYHGTATRFLASIQTQGLIAGKRRFVHLSADRETARRVGGRHGKPVVLVIDTPGMKIRGMHFYRTENDVWLTAHVPPEFLAEQNP
jgi:putative RNA 2'-phosphotransferase